MAVRTNTDWSNTTWVTNRLGTSSSLEMTALTPLTTAMVLASPPCFKTGTYTEDWPLMRTLLYWI